MATNGVFVTFVREPRIGERASMLINGSPVTSSTITNVQPSTECPGHLCVDTQSGSRYTGSVSVDRTVYGIPAAPSVESASAPQPIKQSASDATGYVIAAAVLAVLSLLLLPPILGVAAIICSAVAMRKGHRLGMPLLITSAVLMLVGVFAGILVQAALQRAHYSGF